jgi:predicted nucleic acid-binding protein
MSLVVLDTDVLSSASPEEEGRAQQGWQLLQCLVNEEEHYLLVSRSLWEEYTRIPKRADRGRRKLARYAFTKVKLKDEPQRQEARARLRELGVDEKDAGWVLLAAEDGAVFITWEKYAPRRRKSDARGNVHQQVVQAVQDEFGVQVWDPHLAARRLCPKSRN